MSSKQNIPILHACRLIAAVLVVLVHYEIIFGRFVIYGAFSTTAVSWFFVLSGFILSYTYTEIRDRAQLKDFYAHRLIRVYPVYVLGVLVASVLVIAAYSQIGEAYFDEVNRPFELRYDLPAEKDAGFWAHAVFRHLTFSQSVSSIETLNLVFNGPLWTLVLEMYFYVCFPLLLLALKPVNSVARILVAFVVGYALQFFLILLFLPPAETYNLMNVNVPVYTNPLIRGIEFIFGILLYKLIALHNVPVGELRLRPWPAVIAALVYVIVVVLSERYVAYPFRLYFAALPFVTYLVYALATMGWYPERRWDRLCIVFGGISYVLYSLHWPLMELMQYLDLLPALPFPLHLALLTGILLLVSWAVYRFLETPLRKFFYRRLAET